VTLVPFERSGDPIVLEPAPSLGEGATSLEDVLLIVKERLELLYRALGGQN